MQSVRRYFAKRTGIYKSRHVVSLFICCSSCHVNVVSSLYFVDFFDKIQADEIKA